jgi:hypothetical protein
MITPKERFERDKTIRKHQLDKLDIIQSDRKIKEFQELGWSIHVETIVPFKSFRADLKTPSGVFHSSTSSTRTDAIELAFQTILTTLQQQADMATGKKS